MRCDKGGHGQAACGYSAAGVKAKPAHPKQHRSYETVGEIVRRHRLARITAPLAQKKRAHQGRDSGADVHNGSTGEIQRANQLLTIAVAKPPSLSPDPVSERVVNHGRPGQQENGHGAEFHSLGKCSGN